MRSVEKLMSILSGGSSESGSQSAFSDAVNGVRGVQIQVASHSSSSPSHREHLNEDLQLEVQNELRRYQYAFTPCSKPAAEHLPWFRYDAIQQQIPGRNDFTYEWLQPFIPHEVARHTALEAVLQRGAANVKAILPVLRALIREKRKAKEHHRHLLQALYGACVLVDCTENVREEFHTFYHDMTPFVDLGDLLAMKCDVTRMGYRRVKALLPTDIKWLVAEFGEPSVHLCYRPLWDSLRRDAVRRYSRAEIVRNSTKPLVEEDVETLVPGWVRDRIEFSIRLRAEDRARASATAARNQQRDVALDGFEDIWKSTDQEFIVADLETTGLDSSTCEILELAAVLADSTGTELSSFSALIRISKPVPPLITDLTGISQGDVDRDGRPLQEVIDAFATFIGTRPLFFHNAPFDISFLQGAAQRSNHKFPNSVHDTLPLARAAWPNMRSHKLATLAKIIDDAPPPTHRALADARTTLAVLLAARDIAGRDNPEPSH